MNQSSVLALSLIPATLRVTNLGSLKVGRFGL